MSSKKISILWFRQDLRLADNPALIEAAASGSLLPIYIVDDVNAGEWAMGAASRVWLHHSLISLNQSLGGHLKLFAGDAVSIIERLAKSYDVDAVYWNRCYEPWRIKRDSHIKTSLQSLGIGNHSFNASLLWEPWSVFKKDGTPYRVYTPFYKNGCLQTSSPREPLPPPADINFFSDKLETSCSLAELKLVDDQTWQHSMVQTWTIGETAAFQKLQEFCDARLQEYKRGRDFPAMQSTSKLSPHLHFGEISPHQVWHRAKQEDMRITSDDLTHFLREIAWREFSYYQLYHFPQIPEKPFNPRYKSFAWRQNAPALKQWQQGQTGFPIVDAGMRELWETGYMHNRVRMIVASFLVKNQLIHWSNGASWFWDCLLDADLASNSASWQWCAGCGADAAPFFRIFNPILQSEKFDPGGNYLVRYCPELKKLPNKFRHKPWLASDEILQLAEIELGVDYPRPILDLKFTRQRALETFKALP